MPFPNQFQIGIPDNKSGKLEIHFDDLLVESLQINYLPYACNDVLCLWFEHVIILNFLKAVDVLI